MKKFIVNYEDLPFSMEHINILDDEIGLIIQYSRRILIIKNINTKDFQVIKKNILQLYDVYKYRIQNNLRNFIIPSIDEKVCILITFAFNDPNSFLSFLRILLKSFTIDSLEYYFIFLLKETFCIPILKLEGDYENVVKILRRITTSNFGQFVIVLKRRAIRNLKSFFGLFNVKDIKLQLDSKRDLFYLLKEIISYSPSRSSYRDKIGEYNKRMHTLHNPRDLQRKFDNINRHIGNLSKNLLIFLSSKENRILIVNEKGSFYWSLSGFFLGNMTKNEKK